MTQYLLDTDIAIELLRGRNRQVVERLARSRREDVFLSTVTVAELIFGALRSREPEKSLAICAEFCSAFHLLALDQAAARESAIIRAKLESQGQRIGAYDVLIAGVATAGNHVLVTHNVREFQRIPRLQIEDWASAGPGR